MLWNCLSISKCVTQGTNVLKDRKSTSSFSQFYLLVHYYITQKFILVSSMSLHNHQKNEFILSLHWNNITLFSHLWLLCP